MEIVKLNSDTLKDMNKANEPFEIIGKLKPTFVNDEWTYTEEIYDYSYLHSYPNEDCDYSLYIENPYISAPVTRLCSLWQNQTRCKRKGSFSITEDCFFVYTAIDCSLKNFLFPIKLIYWDLANRQTTIR